MTVAIMQPYYMPYIGYFQMINAVDSFVFYDDVNFINRGWVNRNRILVNNEPSYITIPLLKASQNKLINEIEINYDKNFDKITKTIQLNYKKSPFF
ncbi:MAG: WbqC-like family protein [Bacteroidetes bacterium OLB10]|nr:MAG: WbqC-like family protein [Bacteroidetes bacterium OLB10]